ncbi:hypothetical protein [Rhodococcus sp. USK10]|nr:hypothetical protein [Rhodococcus sp. USK10]
MIDDEERRAKDPGGLREVAASSGVIPEQLAQALDTIRQQDD